MYFVIEDALRKSMSVLGALSEQGAPVLRLGRGLSCSTFFSLALGGLGATKGASS